jgi:ribonuclease HII
VEITDITLTFVETKYPRELVKHLTEVRSFTLEERFPGIHLVTGDIIPIQIIESKKLSAAARERLFARIIELGVVWSAQAASHVRIDNTNILKASLWAMGRAVGRLGVEADLIVVDGNMYIPDLPRDVQRAIPKADAKVPAVMAASVIAKVLRDRVMLSLHRLFPDYGFAAHKGYPTMSHRIVLDMLGPSPVHRLSFGGYNKNKIGTESEQTKSSLLR